MSPIWFDLTRGLPITVRILLQEIGAASTARALFHFLRRRARQNPLAGLGRSSGPAESFTRHQLEPVLILHDVLRSDLGLPMTRAMPILGRVVGETGSAFIATNLEISTRAEWERMAVTEQRGFAQHVLDRFLNAEAELVDAPDAAFGFDVRFCHFADLARRLGNPELATLFCQADSVFFGRPESPVRLDRTTTIAAGGESCTFRFRWPDDEKG